MQTCQCQGREVQEDQGVRRFQGRPTGGRSDHQIGDQEAVYNQVTKERKKIVQQAQHTAGPASPERPRGPGGPMGPACPFNPSLPAGPVGPGGPYREKMRL